MNNFCDFMIKLSQHFRRTYKNKLIALALLVAGYVTMVVTNGDATFTIITLMVGIPLFFTNKNYIR